MAEFGFGKPEFAPTMAAVMPDHKHSTLVQELLRMKYPRYDEVREWSTFSDDRRLREQIYDEQQELSTISINGVQARIDREMTKKANAEEAAQFFNKPEATADCMYWASMNWWTADETTALFLGKNPERVSWKSIQGLVNASAFAREYARLMRRVMRAPNVDELSDNKSPSEWIDWAISNQVAVPPKLLGEMKSRGQAIESQQELVRKNSELEHQLAGLREELQRVERDSEHRSTVERPLLTRERDSLLCIIITMAIQLGYVPRKRNGLASQISSRLDQLGIQLTDDTIRKHLSDAADLLPGTWSDKWKGARL